MSAVLLSSPRPRREPASCADFARLYRAVVRQMSVFCEDGRRAGEIAATEAAWFVDLLARFEAEFRRWGARPVVPGVNAYLADLAVQPRVVRLAGHVFLHVCFDLPRVVRAACDAHPDVPVHRMRAIFLGPSFVLRVGTMRRTELRRYALLVHLTGQRAALETLAHWVQTLRSTAWIHAEIARDAALDPEVFATSLIDALGGALAACRSRRGVRGPTSSLLAHLQSRTRGRGDDRTIDRFAADLHRRLAAAAMAASTRTGAAASRRWPPADGAHRDDPSFRRLGVR